MESKMNYYKKKLSYLYYYMVLCRKKLEGYLSVVNIREAKLGMYVKEKNLNNLIFDMNL